jgi:superfamily I DNA/RNA helicase
MLSKVQQEIVETKANKVVVMSVPASGKTAVLTERVKYLLEQGEKPSSIVVITFTNAAAEEMKKRIGDIGQGTFINTIHSYANYLLLSHGIDTSDILVDENFDGLFERVSDNLDCIMPVKYLLVDEAQDCDTNQFQFLLEYVNPENYFFVGDIRQTIYEWRDSRPDILFGMMNDPDVTVYKLNENYRNGTEIISYAKFIIDHLGYKYKDNTIPARNERGRVVKMEYSLDAVADKILFGDGDFKDWFVLTRNNDQLKEILEGLNAQGIPAETFKKSEVNSDTLRQKLENDTVKVLTIHAAKGLEAKNVIVVGAYWRPTDAESYRIAYVAATRAKDLLVWCQAPKKKKTAIVSWE